MPTPTPVVEEHKPEITKVTPEKKATTRVPSLSAIKTKLEKEPEKKEDISKEESSVLTGNKEFTHDELVAAWEGFKAIKKEAGKDKEVTLLNQEYELAENVVTIKSTNDVFTIIFDEIKSDLLIHLRTTLNNGTIKLKIETLEPDDTKMIYTNREKFDHLSEKYPALSKLKDKLGLDTDF